MRLKRITAGNYETEDGRYAVLKDFGYNMCDSPHPVRMSRDFRNEVREALAANDRFALVRFGHEIVWAVQNNKRGYLCPGDEDHAYTSWGVWDKEADDYVQPGGQHFDTKAEAVAYLEDHLRRS